MDQQSIAEGQKSAVLDQREMLQQLCIYFVLSEAQNKVPFTQFIEEPLQ